MNFRQTKRNYTSFLIIFLLLFPLNYMTPRCDRDDYAYAFSWDLHERLQTIGDYLNSSVAHYMQCNGRIWCNTILTAFFSTNELLICFKILNSFIFAVLIYSSIYFLQLNNKEKQTHYPFNKIKSIDIWIMFFLLWALIPVPGETLLWMCGAANYLWPATCCILYLCLLQYLQQKELNSIQLVLLFPYCLLCGWSNESFSAPLLGACFFYGLIHRQNIKRQTLLLMFAFALGTFLVIFAPGTISRASRSVLSTHSHLISILLRLYAFGCIILKLKATLITGIGLIFLYIRNKKEFQSFCSQYQILLFTIGCGILFFTFITYVGERGLLGIELFSILLLCALIRTISTTINISYKKGIFAIIILLFTIDYVSTIKSIYHIYKGNAMIITNYQSSTDGLVRSPFTPKDYDNRFIYYTLALEENPTISFYFYRSGKIWKPFHLVPAPFYDAMKGVSPNNQVDISSSFITFPKEAFYMAELMDTAHIKSIVREYKFDNNYWIKRICPSIAKRIEDFYSHTNLRVTYLQTNGKKFVFVNKLKRKLPGLKLQKLEIITQQ